MRGSQPDRGDGRFGKDCIGVRGFFKKFFSGVEAVYEERGSACAFGVGEEVEHLETGWVGEVRSVCVGWEGKSGIGCVFHGEIGCEVVEAT